MLTIEQALDILDRFEFFQGQRAGRELWNEKPHHMQEQDLARFVHDVSDLKEYIIAQDKLYKELIRPLPKFPDENEIATKVIGEVENILNISKGGILSYERIQVDYFMGILKDKYKKEE